MFVTERSGISLGVLTEPQRNLQQPVSYLSKELYSVSQGWPHCLQSVALVALLIPEATKLIIGQDLTVCTSHVISGILNSKGGLWLSDKQLLRYQSLLLERPIIQLKTCSALNIATFLPESLDKKQQHVCHQVLALNCSAMEDLNDKPLENPDETMFTDGSSFMERGECKAGYKVVTLPQILESNPLPPELALNLTEFIALTRSLGALTLRGLTRE